LTTFYATIPLEYFMLSGLLKVRQIAKMNVENEKKYFEKKNILEHEM
jgi:hypothetical protein